MCKDSVKTFLCLGRLGEGFLDGVPVLCAAPVQAPCDTEVTSPGATARLRVEGAEPGDPQSPNTDGKKKAFCLTQSRKGNSQYTIAALF